MSEPIVFENPNFSPGSYVQFKGRVGDIEEHGITLKINEFIEILVPLTEGQYKELLEIDNPDSNKEYEYYENPVILEVVIDSNRLPIFKSISVTSGTSIKDEISTRSDIELREITLEGSVIHTLGNVVVIKNLLSEEETSVRIPIGNEVKENLYKILLDKRFSVNQKHPTVLKVICAKIEESDLTGSSQPSLRGVDVVSWGSDV